jgi:hypothetical protein
MADTDVLDQLLSSDMSSWKKDDFTRKVAAQMDRKAIAKKIETYEQERAADWANLAHQVVGREF